MADVFRILCDGDNDDSGCFGRFAKCLPVAGCLLFLLLLSSLSCLQGLDPNVYGILQNSFTGTIDSADVFRGGLHYVGFFRHFLTFPATYQTIEFSADYPKRATADRPPVRTRTGADPSDPDSGGQPIDISTSFQYVLSNKNLDAIYTSFGGYDAARERWILLGYNQISNIAQQFTPQDFWTKRKRIAEVMRVGLNSTLHELGFVLRKFEDTITEIQVAEQQKVVNEYRQRVEVVSQRIFTLIAENKCRQKWAFHPSKNDAEIANITAGGSAEAKRIEAVARRDAFLVLQEAKGTSLKEALGEQRLGLGKNVSWVEKYLQIKGVADGVANSGRGAVVSLGGQAGGTGIV
eukprot:g10208.t1